MFIFLMGRVAGSWGGPLIWPRLPESLERTLDNDLKLAWSRAARLRWSLVGFGQQRNTQIRIKVAVVLRYAVVLWSNEGEIRMAVCPKVFLLTVDAAYLFCRMCPQPRKILTTMIVRERDRVSTNSHDCMLLSVFFKVEFVFITQFNAQWPISLFYHKRQLRKILSEKECLFILQYVGFLSSTRFVRKQQENGEYFRIHKYNFTTIHVSQKYPSNFWILWLPVTIWHWKREWAILVCN